MKEIKKLTKELDSFGDKGWRRRCAKENNYTYQTVLNVTTGKHPNIGIMIWIKLEIDKMNQLFI